MDIVRRAFKSIEIEHYIAERRAATKKVQHLVAMNFERRRKLLETLLKKQ